MLRVSAFTQSRLRCAAALVAAAELIAACGSSRPPIPPLPQVPANGLRKPLWERSLSGSKLPQSIAPVVASDALYAASPRGDVMRFDPRTGRQLWSVKLGTDIAGAVGAGDNLVVVGTANGWVVALGTDGRLRWRAQVSSEVAGPPLVHDDLVIVRTDDARVFGLEASSGERRWLFQRSPPSLVVRGYSAFAAQGPIAFAGLAGGKLVALTTLNGGPKWESTVSVPRGTTEIERLNDVIGAPWATRTEVCAVSYQGRVACFNADNGSPLWTRDISSASGLTGDPRYVFVSDDKGAVVALDRSSGATAWRQEQLVGRELSAPVAQGNEVAIGDMQGFVHFLARDTGRVIGRGSTDGQPIDVPPIEIPGGVVVQTRGGALVAFAAGG